MYAESILFLFDIRSMMMHHFPLKLNNHTILRPLTKADAKSVFSCIKDNREHLRRWFPWVNKTQKLEESLEFLNTVEEQHANLSALHLGIFDTSTSEQQKLVGSVAFRQIREADHTGVLGCWLTSESEGKGVASAACKKLIDYGKTIGISRFEIHTALDNHRAQTLAEHLNFKRLPGIIKSAEVIDSKPVDHMAYVLTNNAAADRRTDSFVKSGIIVSFFIGVLALSFMISNPFVRSCHHSSDLHGKHLLLVGGAWNETVQGFWYTVARQAGLEISVADKPGHWTQSAATTALVYSFHPINLDLPIHELADELVRILSNSGVHFSGIMTLKDTYLVAVAEAAQRLGMPTVGPKVYQQIRDKETLRFYTKSSIRQFRIKSVEDLTEAAETVGFPAVLKPVQGEGSLAVHLVTSPNELEKLYHVIQSKLHVPAIASILGEIPDLILEKYINGSEHNVQLIIQNGETLFAAVSDDDMGEPPWFQDAGHSHPSKLGSDDQDMLIYHAIQVCRQLKMTDGVVHVELKLSGNRPQLIELNARMGGLYIWHGVKSVWEVDLLLHAYEIALGVPVSHLPNRGSLDLHTHPPKTYVAAKYPNAPFTGYVQRENFLLPLLNDTRVSFAFPMVKIGQKVYGPEDDRPWWLAMFQVTGSESMETTEREAEKILQDLQLSTVLSKQPPLNPSAANTPVIGMEDIFGLPQRKFHAVSRMLESVAHRFGYDEILMPLVERASSFSESVVGQSWDPRGCFFFDIVDYSKAFSVKEDEVPVVLIPEGTISVARWLGLQIASTPDLVFPIKIFYNTPCFRNEPIDTLSHRKKRQFDQFGIEILGTRNLGADVEIIWLMGEMLEALGIPKSNMIVRVSNIQILLHLFNDSGIDHPDDIRIKEAMDEMAECRAKGTHDCVEKNKARFWKVLNNYHLTDEMKLAWRAMLHHDSVTVNSDLRANFPARYKSLFDELELIATQLNHHHLNVVADLCVVRSHEYYTNFSFEIDVKIRQNLYLEIAGGGRYNKLVGHFIDSEKKDSIDRPHIDIVPSTGFAFGMQRLIGMLEDVGVFHDKLLLQQPNLPLSDSSADVLLIPNTTRTNEVEAYLQTQSWLHNNSNFKVDKQRFDIYLGDSIWNEPTAGDPVSLYQQKRKIINAVKMP